MTSNWTSRFMRALFSSRLERIDKNCFNRRSQAFRLDIFNVRANFGLPNLQSAHQFRFQPIHFRRLPLVGPTKLS